MLGARMSQGRCRESRDHWGGRLGRHEVCNEMVAIPACHCPPGVHGEQDQRSLVHGGGAPPKAMAFEGRAGAIFLREVSAHLHSARAWGWLTGSAWVHVPALPLTGFVVTGEPQFPCLLSGIIVNSPQRLVRTT